ncbi:MAG: carboxylesterase family protein [Acidobacteriaceae bacterium]|nr:carboxylesterase family protein [Acidobacteriaceae bacterium]
MLRSCSGFLLLLVICTGGLAAAISQPVPVKGGVVAGVPGRDPSITVFKGIPFAAPPVGDLRWREPKPVIAWTGVRKLGDFGASCI